jgi:hypothetical protein
MSYLKDYLVEITTNKGIYEMYFDKEDETYEYIASNNIAFKDEPIKKVVVYKRYGNTDTLIEVATKKRRIKENN